MIISRTHHLTQWAVASGRKVFIAVRPQPTGQKKHREPVFSKPASFKSKVEAQAFAAMINEAFGAM